MHLVFNFQYYLSSCSRTTQNQSLAQRRLPNVWRFQTLHRHTTEVKVWSPDSPMLDYILRCWLLQIHNGRQQWFQAAQTYTIMQPSQPGFLVFCRFQSNVSQFWLSTYLFVILDKCKIWVKYKILMLESYILNWMSSLL